MQRREFIGIGAAALAFAGSAQGQNAISPNEPMTIERAASDQPHRGKVFALITPHLDDGPIFAGGLIAKLLHEGYTGYFIRTSNDEKDSYDLSPGETVLANERDTAQFVKAAALEKWFDLGYRNHRMDEVAKVEMRARLIFLFRLLKVDTVISYDPWGHYEENPDHYVTAQEVEATCWMADGHLDFPEHFAAGLKPHTVTEKYYFARGPQLVNRVVDTTPFISQKISMIQSCHTMVLHMVKDLNAAMAMRGQQLPAMTGDPATAIDTFIHETFVRRDRGVGEKYKLEYAEEYHYIGSGDIVTPDYITKNARPL